MTELNTIARTRDLLQHARRVQRLHQERANGRDGENFNLFHLLGIGHLEVCTHSPILRDLLDPHGSHGQGAVFLQRFVARLNLPVFDFEKAEVIPETGIGPRTESCGGRLDLAITDGTRKIIIIENKIFGREQPNWVSRYIRHAPAAKLVFLSLYGRDPENVEPGSKPANLVCASYKSHITDWLQDCRKEAATAPLVRESITQYLYLVQELTQQSRPSYMNEELVKTAVDSPESLEAYFALRNVERDLQTNLVRYLEHELSHSAERLGFKFRGTTNFDYSVKASGFEFTNADLEARHLRIRFEFDKSGYRDFAFGFADDGRLPMAERERLKSLFGEAYESPSSSPTWPAWIYWPKYRDWSTGKVFVNIRFGPFVNDVETEVAKLTTIASRLANPYSDVAISG